MTQLVARRMRADTLAWRISVNDGTPFFGFVGHDFKAVRSDGTLMLKAPQWKANHARRVADDEYDEGTAATRDEAALALARACGITDAVAPEVWP